MLMSMISPCRIIGELIGRRPKLRSHLIKKGPPMRIAFILAVLVLAACADTAPKLVCRLDSASMNPMDAVVLDANAVLGRLKAASGGAAIEPGPRAALAEIACKGTKAEYGRYAQAVAAPFWWAYWASSCETGKPPEVRGASPAIAKLAFHARCPYF